MRIYRRIVHFLCMFIVISKWRRKIRRRLYAFPENIVSSREVKRFVLTPVYEKSILLLEPNPFHGECMPGLVKYFQDLGYNIDFIMQPVMEKVAPFSRYNSQNIRNIFYIYLDGQKKALQSDKIKRYDFVFFVTSFGAYDGTIKTFPDWLGFIPKTKYGFFMIEHSLNSVEQYGYGKFACAARQIFTLAGWGNFPILTPNYFGDVKINEKNKRVIFIVTMNAANSKPVSTKVMFDAIIKLMSRGISDFKVVITGSLIRRRIPDNLAGIVEQIGYVDFSTLWDSYEKSDFLIAMLNPDLPEQEKYKGKCMTGSWPTMMGFKKPMLMHKEFAPYYKLDQYNAIVYNCNDELADAMEQAIKMNVEQYKLLQKNITKLTDDIYSESIHNLKKVIENAENDKY